MIEAIYKHRKAVRYIIIGLVSYGIELALLFFLIKIIGLSAVISTAIAFWISIFNSFFLQKIFAFKDYDKQVSLVTRQFAVYALLVLFNYLFTLLVVAVMPKEHLMFSRTLALICVTVWNYFVYNKVFTPSQSRTDKIPKPLPQKLSIDTIFRILSVTLLVLVTAYGSIKSGPISVSNADAHINVYLIGDGITEKGEIHLLSQHTNLIKYPLFWIQSLLTYNYKTFVATNIILVVLTLLLWCILLTRLFGMKYFALIALTLSFFVLTSTELNVNLSYTTVRNIEFPIFLYFTIHFLAFVKSQERKLQDNVHLLLSSALFFLVLTSDNFFTYTGSLALIITAYTYSGFIYLNIRDYRPFFRSFLLPALVLVSLVTIKLLGSSGLLIYDQSSNFKLTTIASVDFFPSLWLAVTQLFSMTGSNIFGTVVGPTLLSRTLGMLILVICIYGLYCALNFLVKRVYHTKRATTEDLAIIALSLTAIITFLAYVLSDQVMKRIPSGDLVDAGQQRYLTILPLLLCIGFVWIFKAVRNDTRRVMLVCIVILSMVLCIKATNDIYNTRIYNSNKHNYSIRAISTELQREEVSVFLTGFWQGSPVRFWTNNEVKPVIIHGCNETFPFLVRSEWSLPNSTKPTALLIGKAGAEKRALSCPEEKINDIYGKPYKVTQITDADNGTFEIHYFNYDIRTKLK